MAKNFANKVRKPLSPKPAVEQADTSYPVGPEDLEEQKERLRKAAAAGAASLTSPAPGALAEQPPALAKVPSKPLAPLAALWPSSLPPREEVNPSRAPAPQKAPVTAIAPKPASASAAQPVKLPIQQEPAQSPGKATAVAETPMPQMPPKVKVTFVLLDLAAKQVSLSGDFNGWSPSATPMKRDSSGHWETSVELAPGRYQYKFVVDGEWIPDLLAHENVWNQHGTLNSVKEVRA